MGAAAADAGKDPPIRTNFTVSRAIPASSANRARRERATSRARDATTTARGATIMVRAASAAVRVRTADVGCIRGRVGVAPGAAVRVASASGR